MVKHYFPIALLIAFFAPSSAQAAQAASSQTNAINTLPFFYQYKPEENLNSREAKKLKESVRKCDAIGKLPASAREDIATHLATGYYVPGNKVARPTRNLLNNSLLSLNPEKGTYSYLSKTDSFTYRIFNITKHNLSAAVPAADGVRDGRPLYPFIPAVEAKMSEKEAQYLKKTQRQLGTITEFCARFCMPPAEHFYKNKFYATIIDEDSVRYASNRTDLIYYPSYINFLKGPIDKHTYTWSCTYVVALNFPTQAYRSKRVKTTEYALYQSIAYDDKVDSITQASLTRNLVKHIQKGITDKKEYLESLGQYLETAKRKTDGSELIQSQLEYWNKCLKIYYQCLTKEYQEADIERLYSMMTDEGIHEFDLPLAPATPKR